MPCHSLIAAALVACCAAPPHAESDHDRRFAEDANLAIAASFEFLYAYRIVPAPEALADLEGCSHPKHFHQDVLRELRSGTPDRRRTALRYLAVYAHAARWIAWERGRDESKEVVGKALGQQAGPIRAALKQQLPRLGGEDALHAAAVLLTFAPDHRAAADAVVAALGAEDAELRAKGYELVGEARLSHPRILRALSVALDGQDVKVRQAALVAFSRLGGKSANPKVVRRIARMLRDPDAVFEVTEPWSLAINPPGVDGKKNVALLALAGMRDAARPAVPAIVRLLDGGGEKTRIEVLECLACLGPAARDARQAVKREAAEGGSVALYAAVAILCMDPEDRDANSILCEALKGERLDEAAMICAASGPKAKSLVAPLIALVSDESDTESRLTAAVALGKMGPVAAPAVPALEKMLASSRVPGGSDSRVTQYAAEALAGIGKAGVGALIRRYRQNINEDGLQVGKPDAVRAMRLLRDQTDEVVPVLIEALDDDLAGGMAALALGQLKPDSAQVRQALHDAQERLNRMRRDDLVDERKVFVAWALAQLGE